LTQVVLEHASLDEALTPIVIPEPGDERPARIWRRDPERAETSAHENGNGGHGAGGLLHVLTAGPIPPNAGDLVVTNMIGAVLGELRHRFSTVLVDAPPVLQVGDAMAISTKVDAIFVVTRMNVVRRPMLRELRRALDASPATKLGFVVTGAESEETYGLGAYGYGYSPRKDERKVLLG
jgi:Mrp family chromosome partitioning ATPase